MQRPQRVHLGITQSGIPGLFTGRFMAMPVSLLEYRKAQADRKFAERLARRFQFKLEDRS